MGKIYVHCSVVLVGVLTPIEVSKIQINNWYTTVIALYDKEKLERFSESKKWDEIEKINLDLWWRWCEGWAFIEQEKYQPRKLRKMWIYKYIWLTVESNVAACISQFAYWEWKTPIEFFNSL